MRNLKKTLCLVLALVFVLGLCTVGAANVKFDDAEDITYTTAVKAMAGLGIIEGYPDGTFKPTQNVTRAEAAKIISYVIVGPEVEKWPAREVFSDVPADHWAAKYITFCEYHKVIVGDGNGKFRPNDPVKQDELAKMLLAACGYGAKDEFIGAGWDQNVAKIAFQTKVLAGIKSTDWDAPASREETALMAYNTMMNVVRVVLSDDTESYVAEYINGDREVYYSENPWGLERVTGIVLQNRANSLAAKGTSVSVLSGIGPRGGEIETESDYDADLLGHEVTMMWREEERGTKTVAVAYFIADLSEEKSGAAVNDADCADIFYTFDNGVITGYNDDPGKKYRATDYYTYVLDEDGLVVARKYSDYSIYPLVIDAYGVAKANGKEVVAPEGAKNGDMVTLYQCGDVYTAKACTALTEQDIIQKKLGVYDYSTMTYCYSYNDGDILTSYATNLTSIDVTTIAASPITVSTLKDYTPDLTVGWRYTLYFDAEGGCFAYADGESITAAVAGDYSMFVCGYKLHDEYGDDQYYAQYVTGDGSIKTQIVKTGGGIDGSGNVYINAADTGVQLNMGDLVVINTTKKQLTLAPTLTKNTGWNSELLNSKDPTFDFSDAQYVYYNGKEKGDLVARPGGTPKDATTITYTFTYVKVGTTWITKVATVWYQTPATPAPVAPQNSYIYVVSSDIVERRLINDVVVDFYAALKDGEKFETLRLKDGSAPAPGLYSYTYDEKTGTYELKDVPAFDGKEPGYRAVTLESFADAKTNGSSYILRGNLYVTNTSGEYYGLDLSSVKVVDLSGNKLTSVAAIQSKILDNKHTVDILFVEYVGKPNTFGGGVIYVTGVAEK